MKRVSLLFVVLFLVVSAIKAAPIPTPAKEKVYSLSSGGTLLFVLVLIAIFLVVRGVFVAKRRLEEEVDNERKRKRKREEEGERAHFTIGSET